MNLTLTTLSIMLAVATTNASAASLNANKSSSRNERRLQQERIINGINAPVNRYPYTVSLQDRKYHFCGGSLIAPDLVLSAAHCAYLDSQTNIVLNPHFLIDPIANSESFNMDSFVTHPLYGTITGYDHDMMVIKLNDTSDLPYVRLNTNATSPYDSQFMQVMGWGLTDPWDFDVSNTLQEVDVKAITNKACDSSSREYYDRITSDMLCAAEINQGACDGDSGGPLVIAGADAGQDVQVGVVSWGIGCAEPEYPGVYARVEEEFNWIRFQVCRLSRNPPEYFGCGDGKVTFSPAPTSTPTAPTVSPSPTGPKIAVTVVLELDQFPMETGWTIEDGEGNILDQLLAGTKYTDIFSGATVSTVVVVPSDVELKFTLLDSHGDGFQGRVFIYLGEEAQNDKIVGHFDGLNSSYFTSIYEFFFTTGEDSILANVFPTQAPSATLSEVPTAPTTSPVPTVSSVSVLFEITTDFYPRETGWMVTLGDEVVHEVTPGSYELQYTMYSVVLPLDNNGDYRLTLIDSYGDGQEGSMAVYLGDEAAEDKILAYFHRDTDYFSRKFLMHFTVSEDAIVFIFPTAAPTTASPTPSPGPYAKCNVCGEDRSMSNADAIWEFSTDLSLRCGNMEANGAQGLISQDYCASLPALLGEVCGCEGDEKEQIVTTTTPSAPTLAPTPAPTPGLYPACSVCGEGMEVTLPEAEVGNLIHTCGELQNYGQTGAMVEGICQLYASIIQTECGCASIFD